MCEKFQKWYKMLFFKRKQQFLQTNRPLLVRELHIGAITSGSAAARKIPKCQKSPNVTMRQDAKRSLFVWFDVACVTTQGFEAFCLRHSEKSVLFVPCFVTTQGHEAFCLRRVTSGSCVCCWELGKTRSELLKRLKAWLRFLHVGCLDASCETLCGCMD